MEPFTQTALSSLSEGLQEKLRKVLALDRADEAGVLACEVLDAVQYPKWQSLSAQVLPSPDALTPSQLAVATVLAACALQGTNAYALPVSAWARQHWLGIAKGAALDAVVSVVFEGATLQGPRWQIYQRLRGKDFVCGSELAGAEQLQVLAELKLQGFGRTSNLALGPLVTAHARDVLPWALGLAKELAAPLHQRDQGELLPELRMVLFGCFVAGQVPIDETLERYFTLMAPSREATHSYVRALREERRAALLLTELQSRISFDALDNAVVVLEEFPLVSVAKQTAERFAAELELRKQRKGAKLHPALKAKEDALLERVRVLSEQQPSLREALSSLLTDPSAKKKKK